jgi:glycosyltransferase involved in cell wall biosynthesis
MAAALRDGGVPVWEVAVAGLPGERAAAMAELPPAGVPLVLHVNAPALPGCLLALPRQLIKRRRVVGYWAWELPVTPPGWAAGVPFVHEIWAPSRFTAAALEALAPGRVRVVPHPVAVRPPCPAPLGRADFGLPAAAFVVLTSFSLASSFARKNPLAAVLAFRAAFGDRADRVLVVKISHAAHWPQDLEVLRQAVAGSGNIIVDTRTLPEAEYHALMACADAVLSLHRSEGFGLVPAEAMLLGKPVVATDWSATAEFIGPETGMPVPYALVPAVDPRGVFEAPGAMWADADVAAAAACLRALADGPELAARLGRAAAAAARLRFTAAPVLDALRGLGLDPLRGLGLDPLRGLGLEPPA